MSIIITDTDNTNSSFSNLKILEYSYPQAKMQ